MTALPDDFEETVEALIEEKVAKATAHLRKENEMLREENEELHDCVGELKERVAELEDRDLHHRVDAIRRGLSDAHDNIAELQDDVTGLKRAIEAGSTEATPEELADIDPRDLLPVEKLASLPNEVAAQQLDNQQNRNLYRARYIWKNWDELCYATGDAANRGSHIKSSDVKRILNTWDQEEAHVESKTVERVFKRLSYWTYDLAEIRYKDGKRRLWRPGDWKEQRREARNAAVAQDHALADGVVSGGK